MRRRWRLDLLFGEAEIAPWFEASGAVLPPADVRTLLAEVARRVEELMSTGTGTYDVKGLP